MVMLNKYFFKQILISRADNLGDVLLTLPLCGYLKKICPEAKIIFLAKRYTLPILEQVTSIDSVICEEDLSFTLSDKKFFDQLDLIIHVRPDQKKARHLQLFLKENALVIGSTSRWYHYLTCNHLALVSRKNSHDHEAMLNLKLLSALGLKDHELPSYNKLHHYVSFKATAHAQLLKRPYILLHPLSHGSAENWPLASYVELMRRAPKEYQFVISGTEKEAPDLVEAFKEFESTRCLIIAGQTDLKQLMDWLKGASLVMAASTGPLHLASLLGTEVLGLYPNRPPMWEVRWRPLGKKVRILSARINQKVEDISVEQVLAALTLLEREVLSNHHN